MTERGSGGGAAMDRPGTSSEGHDMGDTGGMETGGEPAATPAAEVPGAELAQGGSEWLETAPEGYEDVSGTATMARSDGGTSVTIDVTGLQPGTGYMSHVHSGSCEEGGGPHYQFEPGGAEEPPNEIHLSFESDAQGAAILTVTSDRVAGEEARSVVMHPAELSDNRIACAELS